MKKLYTLTGFFLGVINFFMLWALASAMTVATASGAVGQTLAPAIPDDTIQTLPVDFVSIQVRIKSGQVLLSWVTASEKNAHYFEVQRSEDGLNFKPIGLVLASGNSSTYKSYKFTDDNLSNITTFYRIRQVDDDGFYKYSEIATLNPNEALPLMLKVGPNPFTGRLKFEFNANANGLGQLKLRNSMGKTLIENALPVSKGDNICTLQALEPYPAGVYFLFLQIGQSSTLIKLIKE